MNIKRRMFIIGGFAFTSYLVIKLSSVKSLVRIKLMPKHFFENKITKIMLFDAKLNNIEMHLGSNIGSEQVLIGPYIISKRNLKKF
ncbi:hypothetical protein N9X49_01715 [Amylibacter sp.]|jgi:hypothetical protein|nr:hypothetical protein [Amylibacter sp.]